MQNNYDMKSAALALSKQYSSKKLKALFRQPVFIVSAPRSGSSLLFEQMSRIQGYWTIGNESHVILSVFPHLKAENAQMDSGRLTKTHADAETKRLLPAGFLLLLQNSIGQRYLDIPLNQQPARFCFLEKTPRNALNIPFLLKIFPDARFIYLHRDPYQNVASIAEAWGEGLKTGRFVTFRNLPEWDREAWCLLLPPGWRQMKGKSLIEIASFQWAETNKIIMHDLDKLPARQVASISYQNFIDNPRKELQRMCEFSGLGKGSGRLPEDLSLPLSLTTLTPPEKNKWRKYEAEITEQAHLLDETSKLIREKW